MNIISIDFVRRLSQLALATLLVMGAMVGSSRAMASSAPVIDNPSRPTLIFVFQPFCNYCKQAAPYIAQLHAQLGTEMDFVMVTDYVQYTADSIRFRSQHGLTMPLIEDANLDFAKYKINGYPNFLWSVPGKGVTNWGPVGYDAASWARRDVPKALRLAKYGLPPSAITGLALTARKAPGQFDAIWSAATSQSQVSHHEVRVRRGDTVVGVFGVVATSTAIGIADAQPGDSFSVAVRAISPAGEGPWSRESVVRWAKTPSRTQKPSVSVVCRRGSITKEFPAKRCPAGWRSVR